VIGTTTLSRTATRRLSALLLAVAVLMLPLALPVAHAEPDYPPSFYKISAPSFTARVGGTIPFTAQTFQAGSAVSYSVVSGAKSVTSGSVNADNKGVARQSITFTVAGKNTVTMSGTSDQGKDLSLSADITVTTADASGGNGTGSGSGSGDSANTPQADQGGIPVFGGGLPRTGAEIAMTVLMGVALIGGGAALVVATRRRSTTS